MTLTRNKRRNLTVREVRFLHCAEAMPTIDPDWSGVIAKGSTRKLAERLQREGLVYYVAHGLEDGGHPDHEFPIYAITDAGKAALRAAGEPAP